jgi:hypothetical protein
MFCIFRVHTGNKQYIRLHISAKIAPKPVVRRLKVRSMAKPVRKDFMRFILESLIHFANKSTLFFREKE